MNREGEGQAKASQRFEVIDFVRGYAIIGVILVNAGLISSPFWYDGHDFAFKKTFLDHWVSALWNATLMAKIYPPFAFLFGLSSQILLSRWSARFDSPSLQRMYFSRMFWLLLFGLIHAAFFFWGDVLILYALFGVVLFYLKDVDGKKVAGTAFGLMGFLALAHLAQNFFPENAESLYPLELHLKNYREASFWELAQLRFGDYYQWYYASLLFPENYRDFFPELFYYVELLVFMLFGVAGFRYLQNWGIEELTQKCLHRIEGKLTLVILALVGLHFALPGLEVLEVFQRGFYLLAHLLMALFLYKYLPLFFIERVYLLGRMTLTWYLGFSAFMSLILFSHGLGLYGKIGPATSVFCAFLYVFFAIWISPYILKHNRQGPLEKLWRKLTTLALPKEPEKISGPSYN